MKNAQSPTDPDMTWGPKMLALSDKQQMFVLALAEQSAQGLEINYTDAARAAGYNGKTEVNMRSIASQLANNEKVQDAFVELTTARLKALLPLSIRVAEQVLLNPQHKDYAKIAVSIMDRGGMAPVQKVEQRVINEAMTDERVLARIKQLAELMGLPMANLIGASAAKEIEGEYQVVPAGLEDIW